MTQQARAALTRRQVVRSAASVFESRGYARSSITDISRRAQVSNGALYFHFKSKEALAAAVKLAAWEEIAPLVCPVEPPASGLQHLLDTCRAMSVLLREDVVVRAGYHLACDPTLGSGRAAHRLWYRFVCGALQRAQADLSLPPGLPVDALAESIMAATIGLELLSRQDPRWLGADVLARCWDRLLRQAE